MTTKRLGVLVLVCSTRPNALGPAVGRWLTDVLAPGAKLLGADLVPLTIGDLGLPLLDEEEHPSSGVHQHEHTRRWNRIVDEADGFVFVTPEYNYGMPATLKNALDCLSAEWAWKPAGFVSYGHMSAGTRAVQHAKQVVTTLRLVPLGATVALRIADVTRGNRVARPHRPVDRRGQPPQHRAVPAAGVRTAARDAGGRRGGSGEGGGVSARRHRRDLRRRRVGHTVTRPWSGVRRQQGPLPRRERRRHRSLCM